MTAIAIATRGIITPLTGGGSSVLTERVDDPLITTISLAPSVYAGIDLQPKPMLAEDQEDVDVPSMTSADNLVPEPQAGVSLVPKMISAEEE